jgi:hypothetical protein
MHNYQRGGLMRTDGNGGNAPNYEPAGLLYQRT